MPLGFLTEAGPRPEFAELYGAVEMDTADYRRRTEENVRQSDATLWFGSTDSRGYKVTHDAALAHGFQPFYIVYQHISRPSEVVAWIVEKQIRVLNIAGNRASVSPGIGERAEQFLAEVFRRLANGSP
jgi:hypothetical protein